MKKNLRTPKSLPVAQSVRVLRDIELASAVGGMSQYNQNQTLTTDQ